MRPELLLLCLRDDDEVCSRSRSRLEVGPAIVEGAPRVGGDREVDVVGDRTETGGGGGALGSSGLLDASLLMIQARLQ